MGFLSVPIDRLLALSLPQFGKIVAPTDVPSGGLSSTGQDVIRTFLSFFLIIVVVLAILYLLIGALRYIYSRGDKQRIQGAREKITYSIVGLIIAFLAFPLMTIISKFFNVPFLNIPAPIPIPTPTPFCNFSDADGLGWFETCTDSTKFQKDRCVGNAPNYSICSLASFCLYSPQPLCPSGQTCVVQANGQPLCVSGPAPTGGPCTGTPILFLSSTSVPSGSTFNGLVSGLSSGCDTNTAIFIRDGGPTGISCNLSSGVCSNNLTAPLTQKNYIYTAWVDKNLNTSQDSGEVSAPVTLTVNSGPTPTGAPTPTGTPGPTPSVCQNVCTTTPCTRSGGLPGVILNVFAMSGSTCLLSGTPCVDNTVCKFPTPTPQPTSTVVPTPTSTPLPTPTPVNLPDLQIWTLSNIPAFPATGELLIFTVGVANFGQGDSPATKVRLYEGSKPDCNNITGWFAEALINPLDINFQHTIIAAKPGGFSDSGAHIVWAFADGACEVDEGINENNNATGIIVIVL